MNGQRGVRIGMRVRDADGKWLGKVTRCDALGFEITKGFWQPRESVALYDEVVEVHGNVVTLARSEKAIFELAAGRIPSTWHRPGPRVRDGSPIAATPAEARAIEEARFAARAPRPLGPESTPTPVPERRPAKEAGASAPHSS